MFSHLVFDGKEKNAFNLVKRAGAAVLMALTILLLTITMSSATEATNATAMDELPAYPPPLVLDPASQAGIAESGKVITYTTRLHNITGFSDNFLLSVLPGNTWTTTLSITETGVMTIGESTSFFTMVEIPPTATVGSQDVATIQAIPISSGGTYTSTLHSLAMCQSLSFSGQTPGGMYSSDLNYWYEGQKFAYLYVNVHTNSGWASLNATIYGFDPALGAWSTIGQWWSVGPDVILLDQFELPPVYDSIRVQLNDFSGWGTFYYDYQFIVCQEPHILLEPAAQEGFAKFGETAVYTQTVTNYLMLPDTLTLGAEGNAWPTTFWEGATPITHTGLLADGETFTFTVKVDVPPGATPGDVDNAVIRASSTLSPTLSDSALITTTAGSGEYGYVTLPFYNYIALVDTVINQTMGVIDLSAAGCNSPQYAAIPPSGNTVWITCSGSNSLVIIDRSNNQVIKKVTDVPWPSEIAFSSTGRHALVGSNAGNQLLAIDTTNFAITTIPLSGSVVDAIAIHPSLPLAYITRNYQYDITILDTNSLTIVGSIYIGYPGANLALSDDGQTLYVNDVGYDNDTIRAIDTQTGQIFANQSAGGPVRDLVVSADNQKLYALVSSGGYSSYGRVNVFDAQTLNPLLTVYLYPINNSVMDMTATCGGGKLLITHSNQLALVNTSNYSTFYAAMPDRDGNGYPDDGANGVAACPQPVIHNVALLPASQQQSGAHGQVVAYEETLYNLSGATDTFSLTLGSHAWDTSLSAASLGPIAYGDSVTFTVFVTVPLGADWYSQDTAVVTATSLASPTAFSDSASFTTQAYAPPALAVSPGALTSTQLVNEVITKPITISNGDGVTGTFEVSFRAQAQSFAVAGQYSYEMAGYLASDPALSAYTFTGVGDYWDYNMIQPFDGVVVAESDQGLTETEAAAMRQFSESGRPVILGMDDLDSTSFQVQSDVYATFGVQNATDGDFYPGFANPAHPIGSGVSLFSVCCDNDHFDANGAVWVVQGSDGYFYVLARGGSARAVIFGEALTQWWTAGNQQLVRNAIDWAATGNAPALWLSVQPETGSVGTNSAQAITFTLNANGLQPGNYTGEASVNTNDPAHAAFAIPVTMTVQPTANMGWVEGYVTDQSNGAPLEAVLTAWGQPYEIHTDPADGYYKLWLEAGSYTLEVAAQGYVTETAAITLTAQQGINQDFALALNVPILAVSAGDLNLTLIAGETATRPMTLTNSGPAQLTFAITDRETTPLESLQSPTRILAWTAYINPYGPEYGNTLNAIGQYASYTLVETTTTDPLELSGLLAGADVFLIPAQPGSGYGQLYAIGSSLAGTLQNFVASGGTIVTLDSCDQTYALLEGAGLMTASSAYCTSWLDLQVVAPTHPIVVGVPGTFTGQYRIGLYYATDGQTIVQGQGYYTVAAAKNVGAGHVALIGFDFYNYNDDMARLLSNAVQWHRLDAGWLSETPASGAVDPGSNAPVAVAFDTAGLQPGFYSANIILSSNDPALPVVVLPASLDVLPSADMGRIAGEVTDAWTGLPLTATVELAGVYTMTADPAYAFWAAAGSYTLTAYAPGYYTATQVVDISAGVTLTQDLALEPARPRLELDAAAIEAVVVEGYQTETTLLISNTAPLPLEVAFFEINPEAARRSPRPESLQGKNILFDMAHGQSNGVYYYSTLISDLTAAGATVTENYTYPISPTLLAGYDVLWVNYGNLSWSFSEMLTVYAWLDDGGAVFVQDEASPATSGIANIFDNRYLYGIYTGGSVMNILPHAISAGVDTLYFNGTYSYLEGGPGAVAVVNNYSGLPLLIAQERNGGRMVVVSDDISQDWYVNNDDNRLISNNIFAWLVEPAYSDVPWLDAQPATATLPGHGQQPVTIGLDATALTPGEYHATLALEHSDAHQLSPIQIPVTLTVVARQTAVTLAPPTQEGEGLPGETITYTIAVANLGNVADTFTVAAAGQWTTTLAVTTTGQLAPGESITFTVSVIVPQDAISGTLDTAVITATSGLDPSTQAAAQIITHARAPAAATQKVFLPFISK